MGKPRINLLKGIEEQENAIENSKAYQEEEAFLNLLRQGKPRKEAYEAIGREKTWASKTLKKIRETEPERLKGTAEEVIDGVSAEKAEVKAQSQGTSEPAQKPQEAPESKDPIQIPAEEEKAAEKANTKPLKQSFSFRADQSKIEHWKLYAETIGTKDIGTLWTVAIDEYISNHKLTPDQQAIYDLKKKAAEMARNQA